MVGKSQKINVALWLEETAEWEQNEEISPKKALYKSPWTVNVTISPQQAPAIADSRHIQSCPKKNSTID